MTFFPAGSAFNFMIEGMSCASCVRRVEKLIQRVEGVKGVSVNLTLEQASVILFSDANRQKTIHEIENIVTKGGYHAVWLNHAKNISNSAQEEEKRVLRQWVIAACFATPLLVSMAISMVDPQWMLSGWIQFLLATPVQFWLGRSFYVGAYRAVKSGTGNMDLLVALGSSAAWILSTCLLVAWLVGWTNNDEPEFYYESSSLIITFILLGQWLEKRARFKAAASIRALQDLRPDKVCQWINEESHIIPLEQVIVGDLLLIRPGDRIPCDGVVINGESDVNESMLSGESVPIEKKVGSKVIGGSLNEDGKLIIRVEKIGQETCLASIIRLVENAQASKAPIQHLVDRISAVFVPIVIVIACLTFVWWWLAYGMIIAGLLHAASVLVIACPCALGLATPTALATGCGAAARSGILIRNAEVLEQAVHIKKVVFDKTGTLTEGKMSVVSVIPEGSIHQDKLIFWAASLSLASEHPLANALVNFAKEKHIILQQPKKFRVIKEHGRGVEGIVDGYLILFGNKALVEAMGCKIPFLSEKVKDTTLSWVIVKESKKSNEYKLIGSIAFSDNIRKGAAVAIERLRQRSIQSIMLTGDNQQVADKIAQLLHIDQVKANLTPEDKQDIVKTLGSKGFSGQAVAMVGDGINDAPALAEADLGIAMGTGTDVATEVAGVILMRNNLSLVSDTLDIAQRTRKVIKEGLFWAFVYNITGIPLAACGFFSPAIAGGAMALSSVCVVTNALKLLRWKSKA